MAAETILPVNSSARKFSLWSGGAILPPLKDAPSPTKGLSVGSQFNQDDIEPIRQATLMD